MRVEPSFNLFAGTGSARAAETLAERQMSFAAVLGREVGSRPADAQTPEARAREAAEQLVAQTLVLPLLKAMRESDRTPPPLGPSQGEKQFRALGDAEVAQRIVRGARFPLVDRLAWDLLKRAGPEAAPSTAAAGTTGVDALAEPIQPH